MSTACPHRGARPTLHTGTRQLGPWQHRLLEQLLPILGRDYALAASAATQSPVAPRTRAVWKQADDFLPCGATSGQAIPFC
jgi:hypothetical protein